MTPIEQEIARQRARQLNAERQMNRDLTVSYREVADRLAQNLRELAILIDDAAARGVEVRPGWLFAQDRYRTLALDLAEHTDRFLATAATRTTNGQREALQYAVEDGRRLARLALGPAPSNVVARLAMQWNRLPALALDSLIGRASDGTRLGGLLAELAPLGPEKVRDTLAYGVATGKNPRVIAREVEQVANITRNRALIVARTEVIGAHRAATTETWRQTGVVRSWSWMCARDRRTCAACWAKDGSEHDADEEMNSHPCCRCVKVPKTASWAELGFTGIPDRRPTVRSAADVFASLPAGDKLAVLGKAKLDAYNAGTITLDDLVRPTRSKRWGEGIRVATNAEVLA